MNGVELLEQYVEMVSGQGDTIGAGRVIAYCEPPSVIVELPDGSHKSWRADMVQVVGHVRVPTEPSLGWLEWYAGEESSGLGIKPVVLDTFIGLDGGGVATARRDCYWPAQDLISFTPAVAVPKAALDDLRKYFTDHPTMSSTVNRFLVAVDEANR